MIELTVSHDDQKWTLRHGDLTAVDERDCRKASGFTISEIMGFVSETKVGLDTLAALEWLARRQNGERTLTYDEVAATISNASRMTIDWHVDGVEDDPPE